MNIDLSKLSAKELFELAMRKEQEEQQHAQRQEKLTELQKQRALLISSHDVALAEIERKLSELTSQRNKLIADHEKSMANIGKEIGELMQQLQQQATTKPAPAKAAAPAAPAKPAPAAAPPQTPPPAPVQTSAPAPAPAATPVAPAPVVEEAPLVLEDEPAIEAITLESPPGVNGGGPATIDTKEELFEKVREMMKTRSFISHSLLKEQLKVKGYNVPNLTKLVDQLIREGKLASAGGGNYALGRKA